MLGSVSRVVLLRSRGRAWFEGTFLPFFQPITTLALLATLVLIFAFQADNITGRWFHVLLIAVPILIQVYFNSALAYGLMKWLRVPHNVAAPGALIGASNFFELAVAVAITLFGPGSGAALATVVGVLVEVPSCSRGAHSAIGRSTGSPPRARRAVMRDAETPGSIVDRMRANLHAAGIAIAERDVQRILELNLLWTALAFDGLERTIRSGQIPDHLGALSPALAEGSTPGPIADASPAAGAVPPADSIAALSFRIRAREISPVELAGRALVRIAARDPDLNAFQLVLGESALAAARVAEREIAAGEYRGPLHGVPIAIKDLLDVAGTPTTAGSRFHGARARDQDAAAVARLRAAGAIIVGKTRLAEFAYSPGSNNAHFGPTRNPHDASRDSGGSSSGSGAAVAAGMVVAALGSDTGGSIRIPASLCGIVGLKPTHGRVSLRGAVPLSWSLDHVGPMTRTVTDAAIMLEVLGGHDGEDARTRTIPVPAYRESVDAGVRGLRIGVLGDDGEGEPLGALDAYDPWQLGLKSLAHAGATLAPIDLPVMATLRILNGALLAMEAAVFHAPMLRERSADYGEFARLRLMAAHGYAPGAYLRAQQARAECRRRFEEQCAGLDVLSTPTMPGPAPPLGIPAPTRFTAPFNLLGWPAISVPTGAIKGMPIGLQLVGRPWCEAAVLRAARVVEGAAEAR